MHLHVTNTHTWWRVVIDVGLPWHSAWWCEEGATRSMKPIYLPSRIQKCGSCIELSTASRMWKPFLIASLVTRMETQFKSLHATHTWWWVMMDVNSLTRYSWWCEPELLFLWNFLFGRVEFRIVALFASNWILLLKGGSPELVASLSKKMKTRSRRVVWRVD